MKNQKYIPKIFTKNSESENQKSVNSGKEAVESLHVQLSPDQTLQNKLTDYIEESRNQWETLFNIFSHLKKTISEHVKSALKEQTSKLSQDISKTQDKVDLLIDRVSVLEEENVSRDLFQEQNKQLTRLQENAEYKDKKSAIMKLIALHDGMEQSSDSRSEAWKEKVLDALKNLRVEKIEKFPKKYNPDFQKAIHAEEVNSPENDSRVLEIIHAGFKYMEDRIVRPQLVAISKFQTKEEGDENERKHSRN